MGGNMENIHSHMASATASEHQGNWGLLRLNQSRENRLLCQENSTDDVFDGETFNHLMPVQLQYDLVMRDGLC